MRQLCLLEDLALVEWLVGEVLEVSLPSKELLDEQLGVVTVHVQLVPLVRLIVHL